MLNGKQLPAFQRTIMPSPSGSDKSKKSIFLGCLILKMEELCTSETSVAIYQLTWLNIPKDVNSH